MFVVQHCLLKVMQLIPLRKDTIMLSKNKNFTINCNTIIILKSDNWCPLHATFEYLECKIDRQLNACYQCS